MRRQRQDRDAAAQVEADEVARAIATVEALLRSEDEARRQRDQEEERERQREEAELARLEQIRLDEEAAREREREEAERQLRDVLKLSMQEETETLMTALTELYHAQHIALDDRQGADEQQMIGTFDRNSEILTKNAEMLLANMQKNVNRRIDQLKARHSQEARELTDKQEEQEDDLFLQIQTHLKGRPNREQRERRLLEGMRREQDEDTQRLQRKHEDELKALEAVAVMETEGLRRSGDVRRKKAKKDFDRGIERLLNTVAVDRRWFEVVWERRIGMMKEHGRMMICGFEGGREPLGLTEEQAMTIMPLPIGDERTLHDLEDNRSEPSIQQTPVELEAPMLIPRKPVLTITGTSPVPLMTENSMGTVIWEAVLPPRRHEAGSPANQAEDSRTASSSSFVTAPSHFTEGHDYSEFGRNPWAWALSPPEQSGISDAERSQAHEERERKVGMHMPEDVRAALMADYSLPALTNLARHLTPPSLITDRPLTHEQAPETTPTLMPRNGNAFLSVKNGECSHPIYDIPQLSPDLPTALNHQAAPPTPPESPLMPGSIPSQSLSMIPALPYSHNSVQAARSETRLNLRVPSRLSSGGNRIETTVTVMPPEQNSSNNSPSNASLERASNVKPKRSSVPVSMGNMYMDSFSDTSSVKNKAPADNLGVRSEPIRMLDNQLSPTAPKERQKKSRWPFRRKTYTEDEVKERMKRAVGDALAA